MLLIKFDTHVWTQSNLELADVRPTWQGNSLRGCQFRVVPEGAVTPHLSPAIADIDGDGRLDSVICGMFGFPPFDRMRRVTLWKNRPARR